MAPCQRQAIGSGFAARFHPLDQSGHAACSGVGLFHDLEQARRPAQQWHGKHRAALADRFHAIDIGRRTGGRRHQHHPVLRRQVRAETGRDIFYPLRQRRSQPRSTWPDRRKLQCHRQQQDQPAEECLDHFQLCQHPCVQRAGDGFRPQVQIGLTQRIEQIVAQVREALFEKIGLVIHASEDERRRDPVG